MCNPTCPYCNKPASLVSGDEIYRHRRDLWSLKFWLCKECQAWVGCHKGTFEALGRLANAELRAAKQAAHAAFDPLWKWGSFSRKGAYQWLAKNLGIKPEACHIGMFDLEMCKRVVEAVEKRRLEKELLHDSGSR